ncbi:MAG TPA: SDR family oxidoreductase [Candidatus Eisenbacteria bacterium]
MGRYLVTGGAGFIGSHIAARLLREGHHVRVLDNLSTGRASNLDAIRAAGDPGRFDWMEGDIRSLETCHEGCRGVDFVLHQAALASVQRSIENPADTTHVNVGGTVNVLTAARAAGARRVVLASSSSVYGDTPTLPKHEEMIPAPLSPYAASKLAGEQFVRVFATTMEQPAMSLRYFNVFGPRQNEASDYAAVIPLFITAMLQKRRPRLFGDGEQTRDFTFIDDVVEANLLACTRGDGRGAAVNIARGDRISLRTLLASIGRLTGTDPDPEVLPPRPGDVRDSQAGVERARQLLGFRAATSFDEGLARTVEYFRGLR